MTNELAIRIITGDVLGTIEQTQEAVTMAVKALSLPSAQSTCNQLATDCISRQAAIDLVEGLESARMKGEIDLLYPKVVKGLIGLPSAQPEIITCIECKYYDVDTEQCNNDKGLQFIDFGNPERMWCSWAERLEE